MKRPSPLYSLFALVVISTLLLGAAVPGPVAAGPSAQTEGVRYGYSDATRALTFVGADPGQPIAVAGVSGVSAMAAEDQALGIIDQYAGALGLSDPSEELRLEKVESFDNRSMMRYQQVYQGIPVMGGDLILNTQGEGYLLSLSGEVSPGLSLDTGVQVGAEGASAIALQAMGKWYPEQGAAFKTSEPELWIYDPRLLENRAGPIVLGWRMDVTSDGIDLPIRELVLVDAKTGNVPLHFNQVDTGWKVRMQDPPPTDTPTETPIPTETRVPSETPAPTEVPTLEPTATKAPTQIPTEPPAEPEDVGALAATPRYVSTTGSDTGACTNSVAPCLTINYAIGQAVAGDAIYVASGTYTGTGAQVVDIHKSTTLTGGWDSAFSAQSGYSTLDGQNARRGVWIFGDSLTVHISHFAIQHGYASGGGGILLTGGVDTSLTVADSSIHNNTSGVSGGGIYNVGYYTSVALVNSTVSDNVAVGFGGGIANIGSLSLTNTTVSVNTVLDSGGDSNGGGIYSDPGASVSLQNSIIAGNQGQSFGLDCYGPLTSLGHNIMGSTDGCAIFAVTGDKFNIDPGLGTFLPVQGYHPLLLTSPGVNAADPLSCPVNDQRGVARTGTCDIGAYEYTPPSAATSLFALSGDGQRAAPNTAFSNPFKVAVLDSRGNPVPNISVSFTLPENGASAVFSTTGTNTSFSNTDGGGVAASSIMTANGELGSFPVVAFSSGLPSATISLTNAAWYVSPLGSDGNSCSAPVSSCATIDAALNKPGFVSKDTVFVMEGTYTRPSSPVVTISRSAKIRGGWDSAFSAQTGFSTIDGQNTRQGIIVNSDVIASLSRFIVVNGTASSGGGIYNYGSLTIDASSIHDNRASYGGGILNTYGSPELRLYNTTVSNNSASVQGGGVFSGGRSDLKNTTISSNSAPSGGGLYLGNVATLGNSILADNSATSGADCQGGIITSNGHNILGNSPGCAVSASAGDQFGVDPLLGSFVAAQGYHPLQLGSPAIDAGDPNTCLPTDQLGITRPRGQACDIGAIEYPFRSSTGLLLTTYDAQNSTHLPGAKVCDETDLACAGGDTQERSAHRFAAGSYQLFVDKHGRNSIDGHGIELNSTVHYGNKYDNAYWNGYMLIFGDGHGFANADDVVAHELTHGVTDYESGLFYFYQSGAINESLSDLWGEYYDQTNGQGNDTSAVKWLIGEDVTGLGAFRSMSNPPAYGDPDKMTSSLYNKKPYSDTNWDNGGVHSNSGVNNKAAFLMVQGGTFNNKTVSALGWDKTAAIYYEVNTHLLASGADYSDLYQALYQACLNLADAGVNGITTLNCQEVRDATDAVQMNSQPASGYNPDATLCPSGASTTASLTLFQDAFENGTASWSASGGGQWYLGDFYASSPTHMMWGDDAHGSSDSRLNKTTGVTLPAGSAYYLYFKHAYAFEYYGSSYYDGGVLEYSTNGGSTWLDAKPLYSAGANYKAAISSYTGTTNKLKGRQGFVGDSHGYVSSRYALQSLAGKTVKFRWRFATDQGYYYWGWFVDDVKIYRCVGTPSVPTLGSPANGALITDYTPLLNWSDSTPDLDHYQLQVATNSTFTALVYNQTSLTASQFTIPTDLAAARTYYWRVRAYNALGKSKGWSSTFSFRTALPSPALLTPADGASLVTPKPAFDWADVAGATGYTIQISSNNTFTSLVVTGNPSSSTFKPGSNLPAAKTLYWRVRSTGTYGPSAWSAVRSIHTP